MKSKLTYYPQGAYMIMLYDESHDRVDIKKFEGGMVEALDYAEQLLAASPLLLHSYAIARVIKNSLADKWSPKTYE